MMMLVLIMFFLGFFSFFFNCNYLLSMLILLEFIFLSLYLGLFYCLSNNFNEQYFVMVYLVFMVCEGVLGLSLMLIIVRGFGSDYFLVINLLW